MNHFQLKQPYPDKLIGQFFVALLDFLLPKTQSCFDYHHHLQKYITNESRGLLRNASGLATFTKARGPMHKDQQNHLQYTTDYRRLYFHINMHC